MAQAALGAGTPLGRSGVTWCRPHLPAPVEAPGTPFLWGGHLRRLQRESGCWGRGQCGSLHHGWEDLALPRMLDSHGPISPGTWASGGLCRDPWPWVWPLPTEP